MAKAVRIYPSGYEPKKCTEPPTPEVRAAMIDVATMLVEWEELVYDTLLFQLKKRDHPFDVGIAAISRHEEEGRIERVEAATEFFQTPDGDADAEGFELIRATPDLAPWWEAELPDSVRDRDQQSPAVELRGPDEEPLVFGEPVPKLSRPYYEVIQALFNAGPDGLHKDVLEQVKGDARKYLRRLRESSPLWSGAIRMPGKHRRDGYRIRWF